MMHKATFLAYRPSQIAATAILVAIDLNKAEGTAEVEQYERMCQAQINITSPRRRQDHGSFSSTTKLLSSTNFGAAGDGSMSSQSRRFNSMIQGCEEQEQLRSTQYMAG